MRLAALPSIVLPLVLLYAPGSIAQSTPSGEAQPARYVIADQDASGPGGSDMAALLVLLQSPKLLPSDLPPKAVLNSRHAPNVDCHCADRFFCVHVVARGAGDADAGSP